MEDARLFGVEVTELIEWLTVTAGVLGVAALVLFTLSTWWRTRSGRSVWFTHLTLVLLIGHFLLEGVEGQNPWREMVLLALFCLALLQWVGVVVYKRWFHRPTDTECAYCGKLVVSSTTKETSR